MANKDKPSSGFFRNDGHATRIKKLAPSLIDVPFPQGTSNIMIQLKCQPYVFNGHNNSSWLDAHENFLRDHNCFITFDGIYILSCETYAMWEAIDLAIII